MWNAKRIESGAIVATGLMEVQAGEDLSPSPSS